MKTLYISVHHENETGKYWSESYLKNKNIAWNDGESIHDAIKRAVEDSDCCEFSYKGKPQGNIYRDDKDGNAYIVGYHYRTKHYIENRSDNIQKENVPFTTWVTIHGEMSPVTTLELESCEK